MTEKTSATETVFEKVPYATRIKFLNEISQPLASKSLTKKLHKLVKKGILNRLNVRSVVNPMGSTHRLLDVTFIFEL